MYVINNINGFYDTDIQENFNKKRFQKTIVSFQRETTKNA